jgi:ammonia channel protein AmtB
VAWVTLWSLPMFLALRYFHKLRFGLHFYRQICLSFTISCLCVVCLFSVSHEVEVTGLDITKHGGSAYPYFVQTGSVDG